MNTLTMQEPFRDETKEVLDIIKAYFAAPGPEQRTIFTGDQTPTSLEGKLPFIRADSVGGSTRPGAEHTDRPVVDVDVLATTRAEAKRIAQVIEQLLLSRPHPIDSCSVLMRPQRVEWVEGVPIRRFYASYHLGLRR
jgi:hypothetical protein